MNKKLLNEEIRKIKSMMRKINEGMFTDKGDFKGGPDPREEDYDDTGFEQLGKEIDEFISEKYPELLEKIDYDYSSGRDKYGDEEIKIKIMTKDGSPLPEEFELSLDDRFNVGESGDNFVVVKRSFAGPDPDDDY